MLIITLYRIICYFKRGVNMKKRSLNKIVAFTLCCLIFSATVANAAQVKKVTSYKYSVSYASDPNASDPEGRH